MKRERATRILEAMIERLCADGRPLELTTVTGVDVFGSYAAGALEPGDIDINIEFDRERVLEVLDMAPWDFSGIELTAIKRALFGGSRSVNVIEHARRSRRRYPFTFTPIWEAGDDRQKAQARLAAITEDPNAGRAPRDHMIPAFEGL